MRTPQTQMKIGARYLPPGRNVSHARIRAYTRGRTLTVPYRVGTPRAAQFADAIAALRERIERCI